MSGPQAVCVDAREAFDLGPYRVELIRSGGCLHWRQVVGPFPDGRMVTVANFMPGPGTAAQLRAMADHLEGLGC